MRPTEVGSGCRRLAWAVLWAPRRSPRPDMFQPLCSEVGARTVDGLPTQPGAVLGRRLPGEEIFSSIGHRSI